MLRLQQKTKNMPDAPIKKRSKMCQPNNIVQFIFIFIKG